jgi:tetratricopeptide (TPR) repeat protein
MALLWLAPTHGARADEDVRRADPLQVPSGPLPEPEAAAAVSSSERVLAAAAVLRDRGYDDLPVLAWALLDAARAQQQAELVDRAVELAPSSPGVRFEAGRITGHPLEFLASVAALARDLPGLLWLSALAGAVLLGGLLVLMLGVCTAAALRGLPLHGHALGHRMTAQDPPAWPGALLCVGLLCGLPLFGVGPIGLLAAAGALGALRLPRGQASGVALALIALGAAIGPGLDRAAPALVAVGRESALVGAWRIDRGQSLPGDLTRIERASARHPDDELFRLALAVDQKRHGQLERASDLVGDAVSSDDPGVRAAALTLRGIASLASGDLDAAIPAFEHARSADESAPVMFNLSQAYGRALRLSEQESAFQVASALDQDLVSRYLSANGANVHTVLIQAPIPLPVYLVRALAPSPESAALAREVREHLLGPVERDRAWLALPILGALAFLLRRNSVTRCSRCERPLCAKCSREAMKAGTCKRCVRLFVKHERTDPRLRKVQLDLDRRRQRRSQLKLAAASLFVPGFADLLDGRFTRGMIALFALGTGLALLQAPDVLPLPWELGSLGLVAPPVLGLALVAPLYAIGFVQALRRISTLRRIE